MSNRQGNALYKTTSGHTHAYKYVCVCLMTEYSQKLHSESELQYLCGISGLLQEGEGHVALQSAHTYAHIRVVCVCVGGGGGGGVKKIFKFVGGFG
jgi:hypothetical protein